MDLDRQTDEYKKDIQTDIQIFKQQDRQIDILIDRQAV